MSMNKMSKYSLLVALACLAMASANLLAQSKPAEALQDATPDNVAAAPASPSGDGATAPQATTGPADAAGAKKSGGLGDYTMLIFVAVAFLGLMMWQSRTRKKQEAKRRELLDSLQKGNKITTIGGIIGTVIEVRDNEVTVKTDESNNVRMKFARWAIRDVGEPAKGDMEPEKK
jgi:preprotein translocase subunit YajC